MKADISFQSIKNTVDVRTAAERYGLTVNRNGMTCCPFHDDNHPSMRIYDNNYSDSRYICFECGETGDVIDFTAKLFRLTKTEAARKLAQDFNITEKPSVIQKIRCPPENIDRTFRVLSDYIGMLEEWRMKYKPSLPEDEPNQRFTTTLVTLDKLRYYQDIFIHGTKDEQISLSKELQEDIQKFERELRNYRKSIAGQRRDIAEIR